MDLRVRSRGRQQGGASLLLVGIAFVGGIGYLLTLAAAGRLSASGYTSFAAYWSLLFLIVGTISGLQQEVARATERPARSSRDESGPTEINRVAWIGAATVFIAIGGSTPLWLARVVPHAGLAVGFALAVGAAGYWLVAVISGVVYGTAEFRLAALLLAADGSLRLVFVGGALLWFPHAAPIAWALAAPFVLTPILLGPLVARRLRGDYSFDVPPLRIFRNSGQTMVGAGAIALLMSGLPAVFSATANDRTVPLVAAVMLVVNVGRAPLVVVAMSLQTWLLVRFKGGWQSRRSLKLAVVAVIVASAIIGAFAWHFGPQLVDHLLGTRSGLSGVTVGLVTASSGLAAALFVTGAATLARRLHGAYTAGFVVAAASTMAVLALPLTDATRITIAVFVGPGLGVLVHAIALRKRRDVPAAATRHV